jgi:hypothetical protein
LFRSIADQIENDDSNHLFYRKKIVEYIEQNQEHFSLFMEDDETFNDYVERMKSNSEWGGHLELFSASQCLNTSITVHQQETDHPVYILQCKTSNRSINLSYHGECHYNSVRYISNDKLPNETVPLIGSGGLNKKWNSDVKEKAFDNHYLEEKEDEENENIELECEAFEKSIQISNSSLEDNEKKEGQKEEEEGVKTNRNRFSKTKQKKQNKEKEKEKEKDKDKEDSINSASSNTASSNKPIAISGGSVLSKKVSFLVDYFIRTILFSI